MPPASKLPKVRPPSDEEREGNGFRQPPAEGTIPKEEAEQMAEDDARQAEVSRTGTEVVEDLDELLDEIDSLLEEQSVLTNFRQKGGE